MGINLLFCINGLRLELQNSYLHLIVIIKYTNKTSLKEIYYRFCCLKSIEISAMAKLNLKTITRNIFRLLDYSGLTDIMFANILGISEKQLRLIYSDEAEFNIDNINKACELFAVSISKINNEDIEIENSFREKLASKHKNNDEFNSFLQLRPSIRHAIRFTLVQTFEFQNNGLIVSEIENLFLAKGWNYTSAYISTAMNRNNDLVEIKGKRIKNGKNVNVYTTKK